MHAVVIDRAVVVFDSAVVTIELRILQQRESDVRKCEKAPGIPGRDRVINRVMNFVFSSSKDRSCRAHRMCTFILFNSFTVDFLAVLPIHV